MLVGVGSVGGQRGRLVLVEKCRRGFLTGVDRRVHAPLGSVMNFSGLLTSRGSLSRTSGRLFTGAVGRDYSLLLILVGSVLRISELRSKRVGFRGRDYSIGRLISSLCLTRRLLIPTRLQFSGRTRKSLFVCASGGELSRIVAGFLAGTYGFAGDKCVGLKFGRLENASRTTVFIRSSKVNLSRRRRRGIFDHFFGRSRFDRKTNLKLSVYRKVMRGLKKQVTLDSGRKRKDHFSIILPMCGKK